MNVKADTITVTTNWQEVDPFFNISYYGLYPIDGAIISEVYDGESWVDTKYGDLGEIIAVYGSGSKIRIKSQSDSVIVNYSIRGFKVISVGVVEPPVTDLVMSHAEGDYDRITEIQYNPVLNQFRFFYDTEDEVLSVIMSHGDGDWERITELQYDPVSGDMRVFYDVDDEVMSVIRSYAYDGWKRISELQYDPINNKVKILYAI